MDPYAVLGVAPGARSDEIRRAYLTRARQFHPDICPDNPGADEQMRRLNQAWELLSVTGARAGAAIPSSGSVYGGGSEQAATDDLSEAVHVTDHDDFFGSDAGDLVDIDDRAITEGGLPNWLRLMPPVALVAGLVLFVVGGLVGLLVLVAVGIGALVVSMVMFVVAPLVALTACKRGSK